jgi:hypothetical protein
VPTVFQLTLSFPLTALALSPEDAAHKAALDKRLDMIRDRVNGVIQGLHTGLYLWGERGTSKSFTVLEELEHRQAEFQTHNSHVTPRALVEQLQKFPGAIHVVDDCESLTESREAWGLLRSALWSQDDAPHPQRWISWKVHGTTLSFTFTGGLILIGNTALPDNKAEVRALQSRITVLHHAATFPETAAHMRSVALQGFECGTEYMTPDECWRVADYVIERMRQLGRSLDLRVYKNGLKDYLQHRTHQSANTWQELINARLRGTAMTHETKAEATQREALTAKEIADLPGLTLAQRIDLWHARTGRDERTYYRRLKWLAAKSA